MRKIQRLVAAATLALMTFSFAGCKMIEKTPEAIRNTVLAEVGKEKITLGDVDAELKADIDYLKETYGEDYEKKIDDATKEQLKAAREQVLAKLVEDSVILKKGEELKLLPTQEELDKSVEEELKNFEEIYGGEEGLKEALEYYAMTEEEFNEFVITTVKTQSVMDKETEDITVTDEEVSEYYEKNIDSYTKKPGADSKHILFEKEDEAKEAKAKIDSGESTFDKIYKEYEKNNDGSGKLPVSQDLGYVENEKEDFDKDFLAGFVKLKKDGQISDPVKSSFGYHIIEVDNIVTKEEVTPFDDVKESIKSSLEASAKSKDFATTLEEWKKELKVKMYEDRL